MKRYETMLKTAWLVAIVAMVFVGCSADHPMNPEPLSNNGRIVQSETGPVTILGPSETLKAKAALYKSASGTDVHNEQYVEAATGGEVGVGNGDLGYSKVIFNSNALPENATVSVTYRENEFCEGEFAPHGVQFNESVEIELSYLNADLTDVDESTLQIYYYNESTGLWEYVGGTVDTTRKVVSVDLEHFSRYAIVKT